MSEALSGDESDHSRPDRIFGRPEENKVALYIETIIHSQDIREYQEAFRKLSDEAEKVSGMRTQRAVLTVPAGFRSVTRNKLYEAARNAGIEILDILNEPTAAMIYYNAQDQGCIPRTEDEPSAQEQLTAGITPELPEAEAKQEGSLRKSIQPGAQSGIQSEGQSGVRPGEQSEAQSVEQSEGQSGVRSGEPPEVQSADQSRNTKEGYVALVLAMNEENMDLMALYICQGDIEEITSASDLHFGGKDWTQALADRVMERIRREADLQKAVYGENLTDEGIRYRSAENRPEDGTQCGSAESRPEDGTQRDSAEILPEDGTQRGSAESRLETGTQEGTSENLQMDKLKNVSADILKAVKRARIQLDSSRSAALSLPELYDRASGRIPQLRIALEEFEECSRHLLEKLDRKLRQFQNQLYEREVEGVDRIFCIGEAVRMPQIHRLLKDRFPGTPVEVRQPEKAALKGALLYAEQICAERDLNEEGQEAAGEQKTKEKDTTRVPVNLEQGAAGEQKIRGKGTTRVPVNIEHGAAGNLIKRGKEAVRATVNTERGAGQRFGKAACRLHRICLRDIGIEAMAGDGRTRQIFQMIPKNGRLIFVRKMTFLPQSENQKRIAIRIYETENRNNYADPALLEAEALTAQCMMPVCGIPGRKTRVDIRMKMDEKGLLTVTARTKGMNGYQTLDVFDHNR